MKRISIFGGLAVSLFALPALAQQTAYTTTSVNIEAGPAPDYPSLGSFGPGTPVTLYGCLDGYNWCDVSYQDARGWVDGQALAYPYEDQRVPIAVYGPQLSLPVVTFSFGDYWGRHYHDRPFYAERERFERHAPPPPPRHREAPPPLPPRGHPPEGGRPPGPPEHQPAGHPPEHVAPVPHPEPAIRPEPHPEPGARPPEPHPQPVPHPQPEARPPEPHPQPAPAARPAEPPHPQPAPHPQPEARPPEPHPLPAPAARQAEPPHPQPAAHPAEEHREPQGEAPHQ